MIKNVAYAILAEILVQVDRFGFWLASQAKLHKAEVLLYVGITTIISQLLEAIGQHQADKAARARGGLTPASKFTAFGRLFKALATVGVVSAFVLALYGVG